MNWCICCFSQSKLSEQNQKPPSVLPLSSPTKFLTATSASVVTTTTTMAFPTRASYTKSRTQASGLSALRSTAPGSPLVPFADTSRQRTVSGATLQREALQANNPPSRPNEESNVPSRMIQKVFTEYALAKGISCYIDFTEEDTPPAQFDIVFDQSQIKPWGQFSLKAAAYARHFHAQYGTLEVSMASSSLPYLLNDAAQISRLPETRKEAVIRAVCEMVDAINIAVGKENIKHGVPDKGLRFVDGEYLSDNATQGLDLSECVSIVSMTPGGRYRTTKDGKAGLMFSDAPVAGLILVVKEFAVAPVAEGKLGWVEAAAKNIGKTTSARVRKREAHFY